MAQPFTHDDSYGSESVGTADGVDTLDGGGYLFDQDDRFAQSSIQSSEQTRLIDAAAGQYGDDDGDDYSSDSDSEPEDDWGEEGDTTVWNVATAANNYLPVRTNLVHYTSDDVEFLDDDLEDDFFIQNAGKEQAAVLRVAPSNGKQMGIAKTYLTVFKSFVGTGVLFLPAAFHKGGIVASPLSMIFISLLATYCCLLVIETKEFLMDRTFALQKGVRNVTVPVSYGFIGRVAFGRPGRWLVDSSLVLSQVGFCIAYLIFISKNMLEALPDMTRNVVNLSRNEITLITMVILLPLIMFRNLKYFAITNLVADAFILGGLAYIYGYDIEYISTNGFASVVPIDFAHFGIFLGTAVFTFEGTALVIPIQDSMTNKKKFNMVFISSMVVITIILVSFACLGALAFGDNVASIITLNLPSGEFRVDLVQTAYCIAILLTYPVQLFPATKICEHYLFRHSRRKRTVVKWMKNCFRLFLLLFTGVVAILASDAFDNFITIVGAVACVPLAFIYPALFHVRIFTRKSGRSDPSKAKKPEMATWRYYVDWFIVVFGVVAGALAAVVGVYSWVFVAIDG
eukprot:TRINITY_DN6045_c0_g1_i1.p1 TRINITY_DN6045_c0_g1~~TRINITY_DN6045_c0_g1_i1.p1  ORF type:complete len:569 (-),score=101.69 TRINITY_DN6045_c0_g1_i1:137-1843(-)